LRILTFYEHINDVREIPTLTNAVMLPPVISIKRVTASRHFILERENADILTTKISDHMGKFMNLKAGAGESHQVSSSPPYG